MEHTLEGNESISHQTGKTGKSLWQHLIKMCWSKPGGDRSNSRAPYYPQDPCMRYLPTFTSNIIPFMWYLNMIYQSHAILWGYAFGISFFFFFSDTPSENSIGHVKNQGQASQPLSLKRALPFSTTSMLCVLRWYFFCTCKKLISLTHLNLSNQHMDKHFSPTLGWTSKTSVFKQPPRFSGRFLFRFLGALFWGHWFYWNPNGADEFPQTVGLSGAPRNSLTI